MRKRLLLIAVVLLSMLSNCSRSQQDVRPNIIIIYADDLGYGDVGAYGSVAIKTPNIDVLANEGVRFTKGYSSSATCTPSRYALLTGTYPWRNKDARILKGSAPLIISTNQLTIPKMLKEQGYYTGIVGKWHLGLGSGNVDWNMHISPGPNEVGFDYSYIMAATQDRVPTVYIDNGNVVGLDSNDSIKVSYKNKFKDEITGREHPELLKMKFSHGHDGTIVNGISRIGHMIGGEKARWIDEDMADHFLVKAQQYIKEHKTEPFFLYYALQQPHVPRTPHARFVGTTDLGPRGDVIVEADWCIGELMKTLEDEGLLENTLIILSSDNGPVLDDGYEDEAVTRNGEHKSAGPLRGGKYSLYEGGTRLPFITYWKGQIKPGVSDAMVSQIDILNSLAALTDSDLKSDDGENLIDLFLGNNNIGRESLLLEASGKTAYRKGHWAMIPDYRQIRIARKNKAGIDTLKMFRLYNLKDDIGQKNNMAEQERGKLKEMIAELEEITTKKNSK